jgi:hypothetical protein
MKSTLEAFSNKANITDGLLSQNDTNNNEIWHTIKLHLYSREHVIKKIHAIVQEKNLDEKLVLELNCVATDYMTCSQFAILPPLCEHLCSKQRHDFIENGIAYSYLTNIIHENPVSRVAVSKLVEILTDRFICEDELLKVLGWKM